MKTLLILFLNFSITGFAQKNSFPNSFVGHWKGDIEILGIDSTLRTIPMALNIKKTNDNLIYKWEIVYHLNDSTKDVRTYSLIVVDSLKGEYVIDEKNGIVMESYYKNNTFTSFFTVMENFILFSYILTENTIIIDVFSAPTKAVNFSGGTTVNGEEIPKVESFLINGRQHGVLILN